jgi:hypothetical protein
LAVIAAVALRAEVETDYATKQCSNSTPDANSRQEVAPAPEKYHSLVSNRVSQERSSSGSRDRKLKSRDPDPSSHMSGNDLDVVDGVGQRAHDDCDGDHEAGQDAGGESVDVAAGKRVGPPLR